MKRFQIVIAWMVVLLAAPASGQSAVPPAVPPASPAKFLFLVEASSATSRRDEMVALTVADLIERGLGGRLRGGDLLLVLPFNEQVDKSGYGPQVWLPERSREISDLVFYYLHKYRFAKRANTDAAMAAAAGLIKNERNLHIYLLVSGDNPIIGTPFDADINALLNAHATAWRDANGIGVIALVAENGQYQDWAVGLSVPPSPIKLIARQRSEKPPVVASATATNAQDAAHPDPAKPDDTTGQPPQTSPKGSGNETAKPPKATPDETAPRPEVEQPVVSPPPAEVEPPELRKPVEVVPPIPVATNSAKPVPAVVEPPAPVQNTKESSALETNRMVDPGAPTIASNPPAKPLPEVEPPTSGQLEISNTSTAKSIPEATTTSTVANTAASLASGGSNAEPASTNRAAGPSVGIIAPARSGSWGLLLAGCGLLLLAAWLGFVWYRRTRPMPEASLITQSMDRPGPKK